MTTLDEFIALRKRLGFTAKQVSEALGLHANYVSRVERGDRPYKHIYYLALERLACNDLDSHPKKRDLSMAAVMRDRQRHTTP